ncbi:DUF2690 domain-containing protein [Streptomyces sp. NPDC006283]|uniref:helix-turn-helix domain-containing protein n=1 Tax=Streptomyces sp. NPDC006283 TaxID=3156741 RepID=UPI0033A4478D
MPRWKELPEGLDPEVREFMGQLRGLVDRSGLSIAAVSDRTGYSKTSWERYLNGRLLAPKGAVVALAEVTGTSPIHVTTMWELAERAWSRAEMRHDMTMEAIRISQAREALGGGAGQGAPTAAPRRGTTGPGPRPGPGSGPSDSGWPPMAGASYGPGPNGPVGATAPQRVPQQAGRPSHGAAAPADRPARRSRKAPFIAAAVASVLIVGAGVWLLVGGGKSDDGRQAAPTRSAAPTTSSPQLPAGVKCNGADCGGQDPESMGCGGEYAKTVSTATIGTAVVEVRYSQVCGAAWARITQAAVGDSVQIAVGGKARESALVNADKDAYTPMAAAPDPADVKACATLKAGTEGCTSPQ